MRQSVTRERDQALRRLRRTTSVVLATAGALAAAFAGLAARALPGRHAVKAAQPTAHRTRQQAIPPPLVPVRGDDSGAAAPAAPVSPPVQTQAPPVAVSGGT